MKILIKLPTLVCLSFILNGCGALSPRERCYQTEYCDSAVEDCMVGYQLLFGLLGTGAPSISTETETNDTFFNSNYFTVYSGLTYGKSGTMSSGTDVDIFYGYVYSTTAISITGTGNATCAAYTRTSQATAGNATIDGTFTSLGTISATAITANLSASVPYLYIKCTGTGGATYSFSVSGSSSSTSSASSAFQSLIVLSCFTAKEDCISQCNAKHAY